MATESNADVSRRPACHVGADDATAAYLIWSNEHEAWWGPGGYGYTLDIKYAGRYGREYAIQICKRALYGRHKGLSYPELAIAERDALDSTTGEQSTEARRWQEDQR